MFIPNKFVNFPAADVFDMKLEDAFNSPGFALKKFKDNGSPCAYSSPNMQISAHFLYLESNFSFNFSYSNIRNFYSFLCQVYKDVREEPP